MSQDLIRACTLCEILRKFIFLLKNTLKHSVYIFFLDACVDMLRLLDLTLMGGAPEPGYIINSAIYICNLCINKKCV